MPGKASLLARRMMMLATQNSGDPGIAYLCAWAAAEALIHELSWEAGIRPQFSLRQNGTLRTHKVGDLKMPDLIPPREDAQLRAALAHLPPDAQARLITHPAVLSLARRTPTLNGKPVYKDAFGQRPSGVLDVEMTRDLRYPVWYTVDADALKGYVDGKRTPKVIGELVWQIAAVLRTVHNNLLAADSDADEAMAVKSLPLVQILVDGWSADEGTSPG